MDLELGGIVYKIFLNNKVRFYRHELTYEPKLPHAEIVGCSGWYNSLDWIVIWHKYALIVTLKESFTNGVNDYYEFPVIQRRLKERKVL
ncbi:hypothetical protein LCGC14_1677570 [marine sediment metagenome]|uniref:Uncharacterized protein n=1 Tax=marine sediment metagenome TaxID=412755 RepID=A0A0F9HPN0_9ZZZZ